jgi:hypothetical protein
MVYGIGFTIFPSTAWLPDKLIWSLCTVHTHIFPNKKCLNRTETRYDWNPSFWVSEYTRAVFKTPVGWCFFFPRGPYNAWYYGDYHNPWAVLINQHLYRIEILHAAHFVAIWVGKMNHRIVLDCVASPIFSQAHPKGGDGKWERMSSWVCQSKWPDICAICSLILVNLIVTQPVHISDLEWWLLGHERNLKKKNPKSSRRRSTKALCVVVAMGYGACEALRGLPKRPQEMKCLGELWTLGWTEGKSDFLLSNGHGKRGSFQIP